MPCVQSQEQELDPKPTGSENADEKRLAVEMQQIKPAFLIKPRVHRLQGRKMSSNIGQLLSEPPESVATFLMRDRILAIAVGIYQDT